jgi:cytochrome c oxidase subunit IV
MIVVRIGLILDMIDAMEEKIIDLITTVMIPIIEMIVFMKIIVHHQLEQGILL